MDMADPLQDKYFFLTSNPYYLLHSVLYASNLHPVNDCDQGTC